MPADIGGIIDRLVAKRAEKEKLVRAVERVEQDIEQIKLEFRAEIGQVGLREGRNSTHSASITEKVVPQAVSWDQLYPYVHDKKYYHLLQRRLSTPGCVELWEAGETIPGVEQFKKVDVSLRTL